MKVTIPCRSINSVTHGPQHRLSVELDMDQGHMLATLKSFLERGISDQTWADWQAQINLEIYGATA